MSEHIDEFWRWARTAPLPVVLALTFMLAGWVWAIDANVQVEAAHVVDVSKRVDGMDGKLDKLLEAVAESRAEQRQIRRELGFTTPIPQASIGPRIQNQEKP